MYKENKVMKRVLALLFMAVLSQFHSHAQKYVVYSMDNKIDYVAKDKVRRLKVKDELTPQDVITIPYNTTLELFDKVGKKKFIIKTPGKGSVSGFINDNKNEAVSLSGRMFTFMMRWMAGDGANHGEGHSDPGTVTREELVDSTVVIVKDSTEVAN